MIREVFPDVLRAPHEDDVLTTWNQRWAGRQELMAGGHPPRVRDGRLEALVSTEDILRSPRACRRLMMERPLVPIPVGADQRVYPLEMAGLDDAANDHLLALHRLEELGDCDSATLCNRLGGMSAENLRALASLAWQTAWETRHFRLAYDMAEIEDMADAEA